MDRLPDDVTSRGLLTFRSRPASNDVFGAATNPVMTTAWKARLALVCLALLVAAIASAYGQDVVRRFPELVRRLPPVLQRLPSVSDESSSTARPSCTPLPPVDEAEHVRLTSNADELAGKEDQAGPPRFKPVVVHIPPASDQPGNVAGPLPSPSQPDGEAADPAEEEGEELPAVSPWWEEQTRVALRAKSIPTPVDVDSLVLRALQHSAQVRAISDNYLIQRTAITEAAAAFDVRTFTDTRFIRVNEPVGNTLTTGGPSRYLNDNFKVAAGLKKKTLSGGQLEFSQRFGLQDSNSVFFVPANQGNSRLSLSFSQPLLSGAGKAYNTSVTVLAEIDTRIAEDQVSQELQDHLLKVTKAYWELHLARSALLQKRRLYERGREIQMELDGRQDVDAALNQLVRARAAVSARRADLVRAEAAIKNAEAKIRALVNAPELLADTSLELVPTELPSRDHFPIDVGDARTTALENRPEVDQAMQQIEAAHIKLNVSKNELRPALDLVLESYVTGLQGQFNLGESFAQQFNRGAPSYTAGLVYEYPWNNRAARARFQRRQLELRRLMEQFNAALAQLSAEVEIAVREVETSYGEMQSKQQAMQALQVEMNYLNERWQLLPGDDRSASFLLGDLLDVQERLASEEFAFAKAQTDYALSLAELKRVTGTLLLHEQITPCEVNEDGAPRMIFDKPEGAKPPALSPASPKVNPVHPAPPLPAISAARSTGSAKGK